MASTTLAAGAGPPWPSAGPRYRIVYNPAARPPFRVLLPGPAGSAPPSQGPQGITPVSLAAFDSVNNALRINATLAPGGTHTPADADQVFTSIFDSTNNAIKVNCVVGCGGATFGTDISPIDPMHQKVIGFNTIPLSLTSPANGQVYQYNSAQQQWALATINSFTASGDLSGSGSSQKVIGLQGLPISSVPPASGQCLSYSGSQWAPGVCGAGAPGGTNTAVQFNSTASFGGDATNFFYNSTTHALGATGPISGSSFSTTGGAAVPSYSTSPTLTDQGLLWTGSTWAPTGVVLKNESAGGANQLFVDGKTYSGVVQANNTLAANATAQITDYQLETFTADPFNTTVKTVPRIVLGRATAPYVTNVPFNLGNDTQLMGSGRGTSGIAVSGTTLQASGSFAPGSVPNPTTPVTPVAAAGGSLPASSTFLVGYTCVTAIGGGAKGVNETQEVSPLGSGTTTSSNQELQLTVTSAAGQCPSPAAFYNVFITPAGGAAGTETYSQQVAVGTQATITALPSGTTGPPLNINSTGALVTLGNAINETKAGAFGARLENLSLDGNGLAAIGVFDSSGQEGSGVFNVDFKNFTGPCSLCLEGYSGVGSADNSTYREFEINPGTSVSTTGVLDDGAHVREISNFTINYGQAGAIVDGVKTIGIINSGAQFMNTPVFEGHCENLSGFCVNITNGAQTFVHDLNGSSTVAGGLVHFDAATHDSVAINLLPLAKPSLVDDVNGYNSGNNLPTGFYALGANFGGSRFTTNSGVTNIFGAPGIASTDTSMIDLKNATLSTAGAPVQQSPSLCWDGHAWNTATTADTASTWCIENVPVSSASPTSNLVFKSTVNGGAPSASLTLGSAGTLTATGPITSTFALAGAAGNRCLTTNASGVVTETATACGSGTPGGSSTAVQFNSSGGFGGDSSNFYYNTSTHALTVAGAITASSFLGSGSTAGCVQLNEAQTNGASYDQLCAPSSLAANVTWTLPAADGTANQVLATNGSGVFSFTNVNPFVSVVNASTLGTAINTLTKLTGAPATAVIAGTADTGGIVGITTSGAGSSGSAVITTAGQVSCVFDGATTAGDYIQISTTNAGDCHDSNASYPTSGQVIGRVLSTNAAGGTYPMDLFNAELRASGGGGGAVFQVNGTNTTSQSAINFQNGGNIAVSNPSAGNVAFNLSGAVPVANGGTGQSSAGANTVFGNCTAVAGAPSFCALTGAMLPSPSPSALGGVQSFAPVSHQWVNSISTSGVPVASQPAFSDISGPLAFSQETVRNFLQIGSGSAASVSEGTAGITRAWAFIVSVPLTISHLVFNVGTADATAGATSCPNLAGASQTNVQCYDVGIFSSSGALLGDIGPHQFNATGVQDFSIGSQTLLPGKYYFALTGTGTTGAVAATNATLISPLVNVNVNQATVGGQLVGFTPPTDAYAAGGPILTLHN